MAQVFLYTALGYLRELAEVAVLGHAPRLAAGLVLPVAKGCADAECCDASASDAGHRPLLDFSNPPGKTARGSAVCA